jgi:flagellar biosynthesis protein
MADPRSYAAALRYRNGMDVPVLVAKGRGLVAEEILRRAKEAGIYVHESAELVALLMHVDLDERIPPSMYRAVAEILAWVYSLERGKSAPTQLR